MNPILAQWNALDADEATHQILPCCGSRSWAKQLTANRPIPNLEALTKASDRIWQALPETDWLEAFASHPRIGERHAAATPKSLSWSAGEQSSVSDEAATALAEANRLYEVRFHRTFIVCATGKSAPEILALLNHRLTNTPEQELHEAAEQQRQITHLRLAKWLEGV